MAFSTILAAVCGFLIALPKLVELASAAWAAASEAYGAWQTRRTSNDLSSALDKATGPDKDTRDLEGHFNPGSVTPRGPTEPPRGQ